MAAFPLQASNANPPRFRYIWLYVFILFANVSLRYSYPADGHFGVPVHNDFAHYYLSSELLKNREPIYASPLASLYDAHQMVNQPAIGQATNPPALIALICPLTYLSQSNAYWVWVVVQLGALIGSVILAMKIVQYPISLHPVTVFIIGAFSSKAVLDHFVYSQSQLIVLFLSLLGFSILKKTTIASILIGSILVGLATSLKLFTWPLFYVVLLAGGITGALGFFLGFMLLTLPMIYIYDFSVILDFLASGQLYARQSLLTFSGGTSFIGALVYSMFSKAVDINFLSILSICLTILMILADYFLIRKRNGGDNNISFSLCLLASCLFAPTGWAHYLVLLIFPFVVLSKYSLFSEKSKIDLLELLTAFFLVSNTMGYVYIPSLPFFSTVTMWWGSAAMIYLSYLLTRVGVDKES